MKKNLLNCLFLAALACFAMSNSGGRGAVSGMPATTAPGENGPTCGSPGCHSAGNFEPTMTLKMLDGDGNEVERYKFGNDYTVQITIETTAAPEGYGFQMVAIDQSSEEGSGSWNNLPEGTQEVTMLDRAYVEHSQILAENVIEIPWTAPAEGGAEITDIYVAANAVNGNGSPAADGSVTAVLSVLEEETLSIEDDESILIRYYPNPTTDFLVLENSDAQNVTVFNSVGKLMNKIQVNNGRIDLQNLNGGIYFLQLENHTQLHKIVKI